MRNERYQQLIAEHHKSTGFCSVRHAMRKVSTTYGEIIGIGKNIVPDIFTYLIENNSQSMSVMMLLNDILQTMPYTPERIGDTGFAAFDVGSLRAAWIEYGIKEGYIKEQNDKND